MADIAQLGIEVDSTSADAASDSLDRLDASGKRASATADILRQQTERTAQAQRTAQNAWFAQTSAINNQSQAMAAAEGYINKILNRYDPLGAKLRQLQEDFNNLNRAASGGLIPASQDAAVDSAYKKINDDIAKTKELMVAAGAAGAAGFGQMEKTGLAAAFATGQARRELLIMGGEIMRGNWNRIPSTFTVLANRMGGLGTSMIGIAATIALVVGTIALLVKMVSDGANRFNAMTDALAMTNNISGQTVNSLSAVAERMAATGDVTVGTANKIVIALAASGKIGSQAFEQLAMMASNFAIATGQDADKVGQELARMFADPLKGAEQLNATMHVLTLTDLQHIQALQQAGDIQSAQTYAIEKFAAAVPNARDQLGTLGKAWLSVKQYASEAYTIISNAISGHDTIDRQIAVAVEKAKEFQFVANFAPMFQGQADAAQKLVEKLQAEKTAADAAAVAHAKTTEQLQQQTNLMSILSKSQTAQVTALQLEKVNIIKNTPENADNATVIDARERIREIDKQIADIRRSMGADERAVQQARLDGEAKLNQIAIQGALQHNEEMLKAHQITEDDYNRTKAALEIQKNAEEQLDNRRKASVAGLTAAEKEQLDMKLRELQAQAQLIGLQIDDASAVRASAQEQRALNQELADTAKWEAEEKKYAEAGHEVFDRIQMIKLETAAMGESNDARLIAVEMLKLEKAGYGDMPAVMQAYKNQLIDALNDQRLVKDQVKMWNQIGDIFAGTLTNMMHGWRSALDYLKQQGMQFISDMVSIFAKKLVLSLAANIFLGGSGTSAGGAVMQSALNQGAGSLAGNLLTSVGTNALSGAALSGGSGILGGAASTVLESGASTAIFGSAGLTDTLAFTGTGISGAVGSAAVAAGASAETAAAIASWVPVIGWVVAIGAILYAAFGHKGGGPKIGGSAGGMFDASGNLTGSIGAANEPTGRFFTPSDQDAALQKVVQQFGTGYSSLFTALGGASGAGSSFGFSVGTDSDPRGSAQSRVSAGLVDSSGHVLYLNKDQSMDDKAVPAAIALELQRGVLVALQHSNLSDQILGILNTVSAKTASADQITGIEQLAQAFNVFTTTVDPIKVSDIVSAMAKTPVDQLSDAADSLIKLANNTQFTTDGINALTQATNSYRASVAQLIQQYEQVKQAVHGMFQDTIRSMTLQTLDPQGKYDFYQSEVERLKQQAMSSNDPAQVQSIMQQINSDLNEAFGLLSPDQQRGQLPTFTKNINDLDNLITGHLTTLENAAATNAQTTLDKLKDIMNGAADKFAKAADTSQAAANTQQDAANTPKQVDVNISVKDDRVDTQVVNSGG